MRIPSRTDVMQLCRLALPSMVTRQSKQMPMRQYGPRGAPETAVVRQATYPEPSIAAATVSPCRAGVAVPSIKIVRESSRSLVSRWNIESSRAESRKGLVRQIAAMGGDVSLFVPPSVAARLKEKLSGQKPAGRGS